MCMDGRVEWMRFLCIIVVYDYIYICMIMCVCLIFFKTGVKLK
jgi:hypothetical protein